MSNFICITLIFSLCGQFFAITCPGYRLPFHKFNPLSGLQVTFLRTFSSCQAFSVRGTSVHLDIYQGNFHHPTAENRVTSFLRRPYTHSLTHLFSYSPTYNPQNKIYILSDWSLHIFRAMDDRPSPLVDDFLLCFFLACIVLFISLT